jgi:hypothetical protein
LRRFPHPAQAARARRSRAGMVDVIVSRCVPGSGRGGGLFQHPVFGLVEPLCRPYWVSGLVGGGH